MRVLSYRVYFLLILALALQVSCTPRVKKVESGYVIRYCDIQAVYRFAASRNASIKQLIVEEKKLLRERRKIEEMLPGGSSKKAFAARRAELNKKILRLGKSKKSAKEKVMNSINSVLKEVAGETGADFIFNYGDGLLYGARGYDVTEKVIRIYLKRQKRSAPVSR